MFFFFNDTATTEIYTLPLHDALPIYGDLAGVGDRADQAQARRLGVVRVARAVALVGVEHQPLAVRRPADRKSTRLNSSHANISYAVFCLKKKNNPTSLLHQSSHQSHL